jgi:adenosylcobyric acid synthase
LSSAVTETDAVNYWSNGDQARLLDVVVGTYLDLAARFEMVICEGAGSPAEINLRDSDIVNMGFARAVSLPTLLVGDIDRGGVFASFVGTLAVLAPADQALIAGFLINKFRGDESLLKPGLNMLEGLTGRRTFGVLPFAEDVGVDAEDAIDWALLRAGGPPLGADVLRVTVVALPRMSNHTDLDALACEPGVVVRFARQAAELADADLLVLPGTRSTVADLAWVRERRIDDAIARHVARGLPVLGICGGYQMLGTAIDDDVESGAGQVPGLGLLPVQTTFGREKVLARPSRTLADGVQVHGYEIHLGIVIRDGGEPFFADEGCRLDAVAGTVWHGLLENDSFRREYLADVARITGRSFTVAQNVCFEAVRESQFDRLADLIADHSRQDHLLGLLTRPYKPGPTLRPSLASA